MIKNRSYYHYEVYRILVWNMLRLYINPIIDDINRSKKFDFEFKLEILLNLFRRLPLKNQLQYSKNIVESFEYLETFLNKPLDESSKKNIDVLKSFFKDTLFVEVIQWVENIATYIYELVGMPGQVYSQVVDVLKTTMPKKLKNIIIFKPIKDE